MIAKEYKIRKMTRKELDIACDWAAKGEDQERTVICKN
jgi:hypothetical protein